MLKEFRDFIAKGNVLDLAVAVIIGGAFGAIVTSVVNDIIMPLIGVISGGINLSGLTIKVGEATLKYGNFLQATLNFFIVGFCLFIIVRSYNKLRQKDQTPAAPAAPITPPEPTQTEKLLQEIRDLLKNK